MDDNDLVGLTVAQLSSMLRDGQVSPLELVTAYLERIGRVDGRLHAYISLREEEALEEARKADMSKARGPLYGIPVAVKDQMHARGMPTTAGSIILNEIAQEDSTIVARLRNAGAILLGKLNLSEFALGGNIRHPYGTPRNPWNLEHQPGPSSSGPGIAVAASLCAAVIGEDTGGSIRIPAAWCGVTGLRPTWGRVSRHGMLGVAWSMDQATPMARTAEDCALVFQAIAGRDPRDPYTSERPVPSFSPVDRQR